jgi:hypothetical protein
MHTSCDAGVALQGTSTAGAQVLTLDGAVGLLLEVVIPV